jgi:hypothetical protein
MDRYSVAEGLDIVRNNPDGTSGYVRLQEDWVELVRLANIGAQLSEVLAAQAPPIQGVHAETLKRWSEHFKRSAMVGAVQEPRNPNFKHLPWFDDVLSQQGEV